MPFTGFIVHCYADSRKNRIYLSGRLEDGRSFAVAEDRFKTSLLIRPADLDKARSMQGFPVCSVTESGLESFDGREQLLSLVFDSFSARRIAAGLLRAAQLYSPDADSRPADSFLLEKGLRGPVFIDGTHRSGRFVDLVFFNPVLEAGPEAFRAPLRIASIDIETDERTRAVRAVSIDQRVLGSREAGLRRVHIVVPPEANLQPDSELLPHPDERSLLASFARDLCQLDPDVLSGWNFLDFDYKRLSERFAALQLPFTIGRSGEAAKFLEGEGRRSAAAIVPGRQLMDALRAVRAGPLRYDDYKLETVARSLLHEGKLVDSEGSQKLDELERLYQEDPALYARYCLRDATLVQDILEKSGLLALAVERSALMGISLDKAWTSVAGFERIYASELRRRSIAPLPLLQAKSGTVSGAAGGTVLDPEPGLFSNVAVFDFRSLYPSIIRTFNIDPLAYERSNAESDCITAPNGARFSRQQAILPLLIQDYFASRRKALDTGDENAAYVYKILMNSFYGVLGSGTCRYGRTELAGAITSFARSWLYASRDWFVSQGYTVLYGDTDSLFIESALDDDACFHDFYERCSSLAASVNLLLSDRIRYEYGVESRLELRFEKVYRRFLIPPLRSSGSSSARGRAKGYGGYLLGEDDSLQVEVKGMEAVRSDSTALARRFQLEALELVFSGKGEQALNGLVTAYARKLQSGQLDGDLVYRKRLTKPPESYTASTPPQVKAARILGWKGRRGTVAYVWTANGAEPVQLVKNPLDYDHYLETQLFPAARSIAAAAGWNTGPYSLNLRERQALYEGQLDLFDSC